MVNVAQRDDRERRAVFERMWRDAARAAARVDAVDGDGVPARDADAPDVHELLDADPTELAWWWR